MFSGYDARPDCRGGRGLRGRGSIRQSPREKCRPRAQRGCYEGPSCAAKGTVQTSTHHLFRCQVVISTDKVVTKKTTDLGVETTDLVVFQPTDGRGGVRTCPHNWCPDGAFPEEGSTAYNGTRPTLPTSDICNRYLQGNGKANT